MSDRLTTERALTLLLRDREARACALGTIRLDKRALRTWLPRLGKSLSRVTKQDVETLLAARLEEVSSSSVARELSSLRSLYRVLIDAGLVAADPTQRLRVSIGAQRRLVLSQAEVARVLTEASRPPSARRSDEVCRALGLRNRATLELLYALAVRASEVCALQLVDLDLAGRSVFVRRVKGGGAACLPLPAAVIPHLEHYVADARPVLLRGRDEANGRLLVSERGRPLTATHLLRLVRRIAARVGVDAHPHAFRRSVATHLVLSGAALPAVQRLLGHKRLDTTQRYVGVAFEELRASVETLDRS